MLLKVGFETTLISIRLLIFALLFSQNVLILIVSAALRMDRWLWALRIDIWYRVTLLLGRVFTWMTSILTQQLVNQSLFFGAIQWLIHLFKRPFVLGRGIPECIITFWLLRSLEIIVFSGILNEDAIVVFIWRIERLIHGKRKAFLLLNHLLESV